MKDWRMWLHGLISAIIGGISTSIVAMWVAPDTFNFSDLEKLGQLALGSGLINAAMYLKQSPLPKIKTHVSRTVERTTTVTEETGKPTGESGPFSPS
jgi:hypothetical protein